MKRAGIFILDIKEYLVLAVIVIVSLLLIFSNDNSQIRFLRAVAVTSLGTVQSGISAIPNVFELQNENKYLREANIKLSNEISTLKETKLENLRLTKMLNFKAGSIYPVAGARIINKSLIQTRNTITLNVGEADSVQVNMPVITDDGLVGRIVGTSAHYSVVQILLNKDMRITVKNQRTRVDGILMYDGAGNLSVGNILKNADVNPGDLFITSEYSGFYPAGIPIGVVTESGNLDNLFRKIIITPVVNFNLLEEIFVLKFLPSKEKLDLEKSFNKK